MTCTVLSQRSGPAKCFDGEEAALNAIVTGQIVAGEHILSIV